MLYLILLVMIICGFFGLPLLPIVVLGSLSLALCAYVITKEKAALQAAASLLIAAIIHYILGPILVGGSELGSSWQAEILLSDGVVWLVAAIVGLYSTITCLVGRSGTDTGSRAK